jgi:predicted SnoaL-like aldol condensation-catalyzing enzyme
MTDKELEEAASGFLNMAFNLGEPAAAVSEHIGPRFVQHNPQVGDGAEAFIGFVNSMRSQFPGMHLEIKRAITQGAMVVTHSHLTLTPGEPGLALADFFRFEGARWLSTGTSSRTSLMRQPTRTACSNLVRRGRRARCGSCYYQHWPVPGQAARQADRHTGYPNWRKRNAFRVSKWPAAVLRGHRG